MIITHLHYDHCGNDGLFPAARYHLQDAEMAYATGRCMGHPVIRVPFEVEDVVAMVRRVYAGRVVFHDGAAEIVPGVTVHHIGGHSRGLQAVRVKTRRGYVVLASDVAHFYAHLDQRRPYPVIDSVPAMLEGFDTVERLATSRDHVVPGHDPLVAAIYPAARPGPRAGRCGSTPIPSRADRDYLRPDEVDRAAGLAELRGLWSIWPACGWRRSPRTFCLRT